MPLVNPNQIHSKPCVFGLVPVSGPRQYPVTLDFASDTSIDIDFSQFQRNQMVDFIQSLWIDNNPGAGIITLSIPDNPTWHMSIAAGVQIYTPIPFVQECKLTVAAATPGTGKKVWLIGFNVQLPYIQVF